MNFCPSLCHEIDLSGCKEAEIIKHFQFCHTQTCLQSSIVLGKFLSGRGWVTSHSTMMPFSYPISNLFRLVGQSSIEHTEPGWTLLEL